jgi:hypothetical protein
MMKASSSVTLSPELGFQTLQKLVLAGFTWTPLVVEREGKLALLDSLRDL